MSTVSIITYTIVGLIFAIALFLSTQSDGPSKFPKEITDQLKISMLSENLISNSPYYLPYLTGERTPINDPHVRASFHNMGIETDRSLLSINF